MGWLMVCILLVLFYLTISEQPWSGQSWTMLTRVSSTPLSTHFASNIAAYRALPFFADEATANPTRDNYIFTVHPNKIFVIRITKRLSLQKIQEIIQLLANLFRIAGKKFNYAPLIAPPPPPPPAHATVVVTRKRRLEDRKCNDYKY